MYRTRHEKSMEQNEKMSKNLHEKGLEIRMNILLLSNKEVSTNLTEKASRKLNEKVLKSA